eukprot:1805446-Rhodomonas_salina.7
MSKTNFHVLSAISLRARYAMSGTDVADGAISLRARYAMSGTDGAHDAVCLRARYAMSGTDPQRTVLSAYARAPSLPFRTGTAYDWHGVWLAHAVRVVRC